ncbi:hypothetical protein BV20DRAFT_777978 [Pilatotrama ljubarskyi]|nr:hypothetical protein BV20DRAFT_777978 [Pilatotrama ljubarskyi]
MAFLRAMAEADLYATLAFGVCLCGGKRVANDSRQSRLLATRAYCTMGGERGTYQIELRYEALAKQRQTALVARVPWPVRGDRTLSLWRTSSSDNQYSAIALRVCRMRWS